MSNAHLDRARKARYNEFYTQLTDIEQEMRHYRKWFEGKTVLCNCDDPRVSMFVHHFSERFDGLGLKRLIATCYKSQDADYFSFARRSASGKAIYLDYTGPRKSKIVPLDGDGDFRSPECVELLKQADIVVTNPPFSLFREYVAHLIEHKKRFLIIGPLDAITYKEIFPLIQDGKLWLGTTHPRTFVLPCGETQTFGNMLWYTNLPHKKRNEEMLLSCSYNKRDYPRYDNFDAIAVGKTKDIPKDYAGPMGVPVTFLDKYNPAQFEVLGNLGSYAPDGYSLSSAIFLNSKKVYKRLLVRNRHPAPVFGHNNKQTTRRAVCKSS